ncbi:DUF4350 domain-containing protein [Streptomyces griseoluteus]|uniref:DUF4350 domain-containing protein n=1 Tax=Streptomyces griseoluteus TaxID=29306 RepID=A0A4Z1D5U6_STRGP|nr:DUF4350 domain-containing protein [Streptomyces griseoluteus]TGN77315.1 DUF4350 domain-containing protein [Streptomyces griseoluteus]GHF26421.1 hypothetical protein GCM10017776_51250 [Streptomyces griseoluteus]
MTTSSALTARHIWTRHRGIALAVVLLLAGAVAIAVIRSQTQHGDLDPRSADPSGSRAVAELLADRGVTTRVVTTLDAAREAVGPDTTLLVAVPDLLTHHQQTRLAKATASSGGRTVLVAPGDWSVGRLAPGVTASPVTTLETTLDPDCTLPEARRAGSAETGGIRYRTTADDADACYPSERRATLLRLPATSGTGDTVLLGAPDILLNNRLDKQGNASLALQLLGSRPHLVWYLPSLADSSAADTGRKSLFDLLPSGWLWGTLQLFVAAFLAAFCRGRRFGPLVPERLPVVIRASETTEGRARLYRKADARDRASAALRSTARTRLAPLVGVPAAQAHTPEALLPAMSARLPDSAEQALHSLLFGAPPRDDAALIALTDRLDALEREVRRS